MQVIQIIVEGVSNVLDSVNLMCFLINVPDKTDPVLLCEKNITCSFLTAFLYTAYNKIWLLYFT